MKKYKQITTEERYIISHLRKQGMNQAEIARQLGRHRSTISREFRRNENRKGAYIVSKAIERTNGRRSRSRKKPQFSEKEIELVVWLLKGFWSPEQIAGTLSQARALQISHETIYRYIWRDKAQGGDWYKCLRQASKKRRKRYGAYDSRGRLAGKRSIDDRPISAWKRSRKGHFEIDTVLGKGSKHCILTMVDRKTGYLIIRKLKARTTDEANRELEKAILAEGDKIKTLTADNGTEFHQYEHVEKKTGVKFYFAKPYHSWERGSNENTNGLIRQYLPKSMSMTKVTQKDCDWIALSLNTRPRKRYNFKSPEELFV